MTQIIVLGHGGYGTAVKNNLSMLLGSPEGFHFIDFNPEDNLDILRERIMDTIALIGNDPILFACDLTGGSPFREASIITYSNPAYACVGGLNTAGYSELVYNLSLPAFELANLAIEASKEAMMVFHQE